MTTVSGALCFRKRLMALLLGASLSIGPLLAAATEASRGLTVQVYNWAAMRRMRSQESSALHHFNPWAGTPGAAEPSPKFTVFVYNYAALPAEVLKQTEAEAARIYRHEGIEVEWLDCPLSPGEASQFPACRIHSGPIRLAVRLLSQSMAERLRPAQGSFGFALYPDAGSFATVANVFAHDAKQLAKRRGMQQGVILGHLIVHEVGHLLLGAGSHSAVGIMHVPWHPKELEIIGQGTMTFTPAQAERMRTNIRVRMAAEESAGAAVLGNTALTELQQEF
jgi:hypothetical protein